MAETEPTDAVEFLLDQHRQIRNLFSSMEGASVEEQREQFAGNLVAGPMVAIVDRVRDAVEAVSPGG